MENGKKTDDLVATYKKNGMFDDVKRKLLADFMSSDSSKQVKEAVRDIAENEISSDPGVLKQNQANAASLLQGVIDKKSHTSSQKDEQVYEIIRGFLQERLENNEELKNQIKEDVKKI